MKQFKYLLLFTCIVQLFLTKTIAQSPSPTLKWNNNSYSPSNIYPTSDAGCIAIQNGSIVKISATGTLQWTAPAGFPASTIIKETADAGFLLFAATNIAPTGVTGVQIGGNDAWLVKLNSLGTIAWSQNLSGLLDEKPIGLEVLASGEIVAGLTSNSTSILSTNSKGGIDTWVFKLSNAGVVSLKKSYGGSGNDQAIKLLTTASEKILIGGHSNSMTGDVVNNLGSNDAWYLALDNSGNIITKSNYGTPGDDITIGFEKSGTEDAYFLIRAFSPASPVLTDNYNILKFEGTSSANYSWKLSFAPVINKIVPTTDGGLAIQNASSIVKYNSAGLLPWSYATTSVALNKTSDGGVIFSELGTSQSTDKITKLTSAGLLDWTLTNVNPIVGTVRVPDVQLSSDNNFLISFNGLGKICSNAYKGTLQNPSSNILICDRDSVTLSYSNDPNFSLQWRKNGIDISGEANRNLKVKQAGKYTLHFTDIACGGIGNTDTITVNFKPYLPVISATTDTTVCDGQSVSLKVDFPITAGTCTPSNFQWKKDGVNIIGATLATYSTTLAGNYSVTVSGPSVSATTRSIKVSNKPFLPTITAVGDTIICDGLAANLKVNFPATAGSCTPSNFQWKKDGVNISGATLATYSTTLAGNYSVTVSGPNTSVTTRSIKVSNKTYLPTISAIGDTIVCDGLVANLKVEIPTTAGSCTPSNFQWKKDGVNISGATLATYSTSLVGNYSVTVSGPNTSVTTRSIKVSNKPYLPTISAIGDTIVCDGLVANLKVEIPTTAGSCTPTNYQWKKDGVNISGATLATYSTSLVGNYSVTVSGPNTSVTTRSIKVSNKAYAPTIVALTDTTVCDGTSVNLKVNLPTTPGTCTPTNYQWQKDGVNISGATLATYSTTIPGNYRVILSGTTQSTTTRSIKVTIKPLLPTISANTDTIVCDGATAILKVTMPTTLGACTPTSYQWIKDGVNIVGATLTTYSATTAGDYSVKVSGPSVSATTRAIKVSIKPYLPTISATGDTTICDGQTVNLKVTLPTTAGTCTPTSYQWMKDGVNIVGATLATYTANTAGNYSVKLLGPNTSIATRALKVSIKPYFPTILTTGSTTICDGDTVLLTATQSATGTCTAIAYQWYKNDIAIAGATSIKYKAIESGSYKVEIGTNRKDFSAPVVIQVNFDAPTLTVSGAILRSGNYEICEGQSAKIKSSVTCKAKSYQWNLNGNPILNATKDSLSINTNGVYTLTIKSITGNLTKTSTNTTLIVNQNPIANAGTNATLTGTEKFNTTSVITASLGTLPYTYSWSTSPIVTGHLSTDANPIFGPFNQSTNISLAIIDSKGCKANASASVTYIPCTIASNIIGKNYYCSGSNTPLRANVLNDNGGLTYKWKKNGQDVFSSTDKIDVAQEGNYAVYVEDAKGCAILSSELKVEENLALFANAGGGGVLSGTQVYDLSKVNIAVGGLPPYTYVWKTFPVINGHLSTASNPTFGPFSFNTDITVDVIDSRGCKAGAGATVDFLPCAFKVITKGRTEFCEGETSTIEASTEGGAGPFTFKWTLNNQPINNNKEIENATKSGILAVIVTDDKGCTSSNSTLITVNPLPKIDISGNQNFCFGENTTIASEVSLGTKPYVYNWYWGNAFAGNERDLTTNKNGSYFLKITDSKNCFTESKRISISENEKLISTIKYNGTKPETYIKGGLTFTASQELNLTYQWKKDNVNIPGATLATYAPIESGSYTVTITRSGCSATSESVNFVLLIPTANETNEILNSKSIQILSNPVSDQIKVKISLDKPSSLKLALYNERGTVVGSWTLPKNKKEQEHTIDVSEQKTGNYFLKVQSGNEQITKKIAKQ
ncbi:MAG: T9SS type A sorting domain-containing protein [Pseudarcicella sp.]|nr:T9SS type A sorting domain-containing protein [Pseudarcicella sp.]